MEPWSVACRCYETASDGRSMSDIGVFGIGHSSAPIVHWLLMIVDGFPEPQPQVQHPQPAAQSPHKSVGDERTQPGHRNQ